VALERTDVSEERIAYIINVKGINQLGKKLAVTQILKEGTSFRKKNWMMIFLRL
jgi:hypothetical protein